MEEEPGERPEESRRRVLATLGVAAMGTVGVLGATAGTNGRGRRAELGNGTNESGTNESDAAAGPTARPPTTLVLGGETDGWLGLAPDAVEGVRNPPLTLSPGETYRVVWVNLDGERHRFQALDGADRPVAETGPAGAVGATRATTFEATEGLAAYRCRFHPQPMRGAVVRGPGRPAGNGTAGNRTAGNETSGNRTAENETSGNRTAGNETAAPPDGGVVRVAVGPEGNYFRFVPETVTVATGGTVRWTAESVGHNVSGRPEDSDAVRLPPGAEPFSSYPDGESYAVIGVGDSYEHTFAVPGEYVYVCLPHVSEGMVGTVRVTG